MKKINYFVDFEFYKEMIPTMFNSFSVSSFKDFV